MRNRSQQFGFSLIEILIGMTIGMIVILVIMQTMSLFEGQRKTSNSAADMQSNGLLALYSLEQDVRLAGYGLVVNNLGVGDLPCVKINGHAATNSGVFDAIPLSISSSGVLDSISIARIDTTTGGLVTGGAAAHALSAIPTIGTFSTGFVVDVSSGVFRMGGMTKTVSAYPPQSVDSGNLVYTATAQGAGSFDFVLVSANSGVAKLDCTLLRVFNIISDVPYAPAINAVINDNASTVPPVSAVTLAGVKVPGSVVNAGETITSGVPAQPAWSKLALANALNVGFDSTQTPVFPPGGYPATSAALNTNTVLHNLGMTPVLTRTRFAVNTSAQFTRQINNATPEVVAENIVSLQAQYGIANAGQQSISCWVNPTGVNTNPASPTCLAGDTADWTMAGLQATPDNIKRIKAIRVAVVARNNLRQKATNGVCTTTITAPVSWLNGPAVDLSGNPDWRCYRYKVYQTIIPMNNVILGNV